ncbi:MAG: fibrobacter succinogenes major paralogous domain-containing protein [Fibrobacter sp.]|nr:fibrobacter succinogenes major paralogous domain-containing protein [Fibrobacter sp.]
MLKAKHGFSFVVAAVSVLLLVACGDDNSDFATHPSEGSSSSVTPQSSSSSKVTEPAEVTTGTMTDSRDGLTYKTVTIGTQTWMAENLNYETENSYCYKDNASNCSKYGRLYIWAAAMDSVGTWSTNGKGCGYGTTCSPTYPVRGICPEGWHLPTKADFETLFTAVGGKSIAAQKLKSTTGWTTYRGITNEDAFAFSALPAGFRLDDGYFSSEGYDAFFWSSTEYGSDFAYYVGLGYNDGDASLGSSYKSYGFSVRCLKD